MSAERVPASSSPHRGLRAFVIALLVVALGGAGLAAWRSHQESATASVLFTVHGGQAHLVADPGAPTGYRLLVQDVDPEAMWFTDRPKRDGGQVPLAVVVQEWAGYGFDADPPNAALVAGALTASPATALVELGHPAYDPTRAAMIVDVRFLDDTSRLRPTTDFEPLDIGAVSLFIDDAEVPLVPAASAAPTPASTAANTTTSTTTTAPVAPATDAPAASSSPTPAPTDAATGDGTTDAPSVPAASTTASPTASQATSASEEPSPTPWATTTPPASAPTGMTSVLVPTDPAAWTYHSFVLPTADDNRYVAKVNIDNDNIDPATGQFIYSFNANSLVSGFSDYHLNIADSTHGIHLYSGTSANDL